MPLLPFFFAYRTSDPVWREENVGVAGVWDVELTIFPGFLGRLLGKTAVTKRFCGVSSCKTCASFGCRWFLFPEMRKAGFIRSALLDDAVRRTIARLEVSEQAEAIKRLMETP